MRKRRVNRALALALSVALASGNATPVVTQAAQQSTVQMEETAEQVDEEVQESAEQDDLGAESTSEEESPVEDAVEAGEETAQEDTALSQDTTEAAEEELSTAEESVAETQEITSTTILEYEAEDYTLKYQIREVNGKKEAIIRGYGDKYSGRDVVIPDSVSASDTYSNYLDYQNIPVTAIMQNAFADNCPTSIYIPACVESIGVNAFAGGSKQKVYTLKSVTIEDGSKLTEIGKWAFQNQAALAGEFTIPKGVTTIGEGAFFNCEKLTKITFNGGGTIEKQAFSGCTGVEGDLVLPTNVTSVGDEAFMKYGSSKDPSQLVLPSGLVSIGEKAFSTTKFTGDLKIPSTVETIGKNAFQSAYTTDKKEDGNVSTLTFEDGSVLTSIGDYAFSQCISLTGDIKIPNSVTSIGANAFNKCSGFDGTLTLSTNLTTIGNYAFSECTALTGALTIPNTVNSVGNYAFNKCSSFDGKLTLSTALTKISQYAFNGCSGLIGDLVIPSSVKTIETRAFSECSSLNGTLTLPADVTTIGAYAFYECKSLTGKLVIPSTVTAITQYAFNNCSGFNSLTLPDTITKIDKCAFNGCSGFENEFKLPASVTTIGESAFMDCTGFIGNLDIPEKVTSVGKSAFANMIGLTGYLYLPAKLTTFGDNCFAGCGGLTNQKDKDGKDITIMIAEGTKILPQYMFYACENLTSIQVPQTIQTINSAAFAKTNNGLTLYVFAGGDGAKWARSLSSDEKTFKIEYLDALAAVTLSNRTYTMRVGNTRDLSATVRYYVEKDGVDVPVDKTEKEAPDKLVWTMSSKGAYASYAGGKVTAVKAGSERITVMPEDGKTSDICAVTVVDKYVKSVKLDDTKQVNFSTAKKDGSVVMTATISMQGFAEALSYNEIKKEDFQAVFKAKDAGIVKIVQGDVQFNDDFTEATVTATITPVKSGTTSVSLEANVAGDAKTTVSSTRTFKVTTPLKSVQIPKTAKVKEGKTVALAVTYNPSDATTQKVTWTSSDTSIATVSSSGVVTGKKEGKVQITCTPVNNADYGDAAAEVTCTVTVESKTALEVVTNVKAVSAGKNKIKLTWDKSPYAEGYIIYAKKNGVYGYCGMTTSQTATSYTDTKAPDKEYGFYWVYAYKTGANGKRVMSPVGKYVYAKGTCLEVANLKAYSQKGNVKLTWTKSEGAQGYLIYGKRGKDDKYAYIGMTAKGTATSYVDKKAAKDKYNFYWIIPYHKDASGNRVYGKVSSKYVYGKAK